MRRAIPAGLILLCACAPAGTSSDTNGAVHDAWSAHRSHVEVQAEGSIARTLGVRAGSRGAHQGFLLHLRGASGRGLTVKVEVNTDFTGILPLASGDEVRVRGEYEYDPRGGVIHWTHRDPRGRHPDGYVEFRGRRYSHTFRDRSAPSRLPADILTLSKQNSRS